MHCIQHKGVFDVPEVEDGESNAFQQEAIIDIVPINVKDNVKYCMGDVEAKVQLKVELQETLYKMKSINT